MAQFCAAATGPPGRLAWCIIPPPLTVPVQRGDSPAVREVVGPCRAVSATGRRHPPPPAHGMPQERDPDAPLVRLPGRPSLLARQQDRTAKCAPQRRGPTHPRPAAGKREPVRVSFNARPGPSARSRPSAMVSGPAGSRDRGCPPSRPAPYAGEPRGDERGIRGSPPDRRLSGSCPGRWCKSLASSAVSGG